MRDGIEALEVQVDQRELRVTRHAPVAAKCPEPKPPLTRANSKRLKNPQLLNDEPWNPQRSASTEGLCSKLEVPRVLSIIVNKDMHTHTYMYAYIIIIVSIISIATIGVHWCVFIHRFVYLDDLSTIIEI